MNIYSWLRVGGNLFALVQRIGSITAIYEHQSLGTSVFTYQEDGTITSEAGDVATPVTNESQELFPELAGFPDTLTFGAHQLDRIEILIAKNQMHVWPYRRSDNIGGVVYVYHNGKAFDVFEPVSGGSLSWLGQAV